MPELRTLKSPAKHLPLSATLPSSLLLSPKQECHSLLFPQLHYKTKNRQEKKIKRKLFPSFSLYNYDNILVCVKSLKLDKMNPKASFCLFFPKLPLPRLYFWKGLQPVLPASAESEAPASSAWNQRQKAGYPGVQPCKEKWHPWARMGSGHFPETVPDTLNYKILLKSLFLLSLSPSLFLTISVSVLGTTKVLR